MTAAAPAPWDGHGLPTLASLRACGAVPHYFGLGFVQLKLSDTRRLHFWHPSCEAIVGEEEIHDHRYDFVSHVLAGTVVHETWDYSPCADGGVEAFKVSCKPGVPSDPAPSSRGKASRTGMYSLAAGSFYRFPAGAFHRSEGKSAVTSLTRGPVVLEEATVLRPLGAPPVCAFSRPMPEADCWAAIADMLPS